MSLSCQYFERKACQSCSLLSRDENTHKRFKTKALLNSMTAVIEVETCIKELVEPSFPFDSRSKAKLSVSGSSEVPIIGLIDREYRGVELVNCPLHFKEINAVIQTLPSIISDFKLYPYCIKKKQGELKGIILNSNSRRSQLMLRFVLRSTEALPRIKKALPRILDENPLLKVVTANIQPIPHQVPEGEKEHVLSENEWIFETYGEKEFFLGPKSFTQVSPEVASALYSYVAEVARELRPKLAIDLYCGIGGFAMHLAEHTRKVVGVEFSESAIDAATLSAEKNRLSNLEFLSGDVEGFLVDFLTSKKETPELVVCNPPRRGLSQGIIESLVSLEPKVLVYSSCNPETLARDIELLSGSYSLKTLAPFDMFPLTEHLEVVARLDLTAMND